MHPYVFYKNAGETMNDTVDRFRTTYKITDKICYCGRLDPMARGLVLLLIGHECIYMNEFNKVSKEYTFEILFGIMTDTDDVMGKILQVNESQYIDIKKYITIGNFSQKYHDFSSKKHKGKSLWYYKLNNIDIPQYSHQVSIYNVAYYDVKKYNFNNLRKEIIKNITNIKQNLRQTEISMQYSMINNIEYIYSLPIKIIVSSGFYVRQLVHDIMEHIKYPILTYDINRTQLFLKYIS